MNSNPIPQGKYTPATKSGNLIFTAGMTPRINGELIYKGKIKKNVPIEEYRDAVRLSIENAVNATQNLLEKYEMIKNIINLTIYVLCEDGFQYHSKIADFASEYLYESFGENGVSSRTVVGVFSLPMNATLEIQLVSEIEKTP